MGKPHIFCCDGWLDGYTIHFTRLDMVVWYAKLSSVREGLVRIAYSAIEVDGNKDSHIINIVHSPTAY